MGGSYNHGELYWKHTDPPQFAIWGLGGNMVGVLGFIFIIFVAAPLLSTLGYHLIRGAKSITADSEQAPYSEQPAGRIHLFEGDRYLNSSPDNPYEHSALNWADGRIGCALSTELAEHPEYQPALIGTIQVLKPEREKGIVAVILDNEKVAALGLAPAGLISGAQMVVDSVIPAQTLHAH